MHRFPTEMGDEMRTIAICSGKMELSVFENLAEEMLVEILHRLPLKSVHVCKSLSKHFYSLISRPYFACLYVRRLSLSLPSQAPPFTLVCECFSYHKVDHGFHIGYIHFLCDSQLNSLNFSLNFLSLPPFRSSLILGSSNGLILFSSRPNIVYYVCNPLTRKWIALPPSPRSPERLLVGFLCDPCCDGAGGTSFKVVRVGLNKSMNVLNMGIFSSETNEWTDLILPSPGKFVCSNPWAVACKNSLHWVSEVSGVILACNPSNMYDQCRLIRLPKVHHQNGRVCIGVCQGRLRYVQLLSCSGFIFTPNFSIWELKDYNGGEWCLEHQICFSQIREETSRSPSHLGCHHAIQPLAVHPLDPNIVYLSSRNQVISYNMQTRTAEVIYHVYGHNQSFLNGIAAFPFVLPWWPASLPALQQSDDKMI